MRYVTLAIIALGLFIGPMARPAAAVSIDDLLNLRANGLSDDLLVALIETDGSVFHLSTADVTALHKRGAGDRLIIAMLEADKRASASARTESHKKAPARPIVVGQTIVVPVETAQNTTAVIVAVPVALVGPVKPVEPVYWGFGGHQRPGSWTPPTH